MSLQYFCRLKIIHITKTRSLFDIYKKYINKISNKHAKKKEDAKILLVRLDLDGKRVSIRARCFIQIFGNAFLGNLIGDHALRAACDFTRDESVR